MNGINVVRETVELTLISDTSKANSPVVSSSPLRSKRGKTT